MRQGPKGGWWWRQHQPWVWTEESVACLPLHTGHCPLLCPTLEGQGLGQCKATDDPKDLWGWPQMAVTHTLAACLPADSKRNPTGFLKKEGCPIPGLWAEEGPGPGGPCPTCESWQGPSAVSASHRLPCPVPELRERGDPNGSPGCAEGHLGYIGEGRPPHTHRGPLQSHGTGHHPDGCAEEVRTSLALGLQGWAGGAGGGGRDSYGSVRKAEFSVLDPNGPAMC